MNALMGFVSDALVATLQSLPIDQALKNQAVRAFCKLLWLQNDLITRHYQAEEGAPIGNGQKTGLVAVAR
jgi:hypothetical protein